MEPIEVAAPKASRKRQSCCEGCSTYLFSTNISDDEQHSLYMDEGRVILGEWNWATPLSVLPGDNGTLTIGVEGSRGKIEAAGGSLRVSETGTTEFILEPASEAGELFRLKIQDGLYVAVSTPGTPVSLSREQSEAAGFSLRPNVPKVLPHWAAEHVSDETRSTHLWIFNRVYNTMTSNRDVGRKKDELQQCLQNTEFVRGIRQGIYDADNGADEYSGFIYSAHFYHPEKKAGGDWDPLNAPINYGERNALYYGKYYFERSMGATDPYTSGFNLGLAIHYLEDLTQPMHCGIFPNNPGDPLGLSFRGYRHENYELWALGMQSPYRLDAAELHPEEFQGWQPEKYWQWTAEKGLAMFRRWEKQDSSPIAKSADGKKYPDSHEPRPFNRGKQEWVGDTAEQLRLAQRVVAGLLFAWSDRPSAMVEKIRGVVRTDDMVLMSVSFGQMARAPQPGEVGDNQIHSATKKMPGQDFWWNLEPVLEGGQQVYEGQGAQRSPVYYIRNKKTGKYMVAGDSFDGNVYHLPHQNRLNAQWIFERAVDAKTGQPLEYYHERSNHKYPVHWAKDRKRAKEQKNYYLAGWPNGTPGPLQDSAYRYAWVEIPAFWW